MSAQQKIQPCSRIEEIEADLLAYRNGWLQYDSAHVRQLQAERMAILKSLLNKEPIKCPP